MAKIIIKETNESKHGYPEYVVRGYCPYCNTLLFIQHKYKVKEMPVIEKFEYPKGIKVLNENIINTQYTEHEQQYKWNYELDKNGNKIEAKFVGEFNFCYQCKTDLDPYPPKEE